MYLNIYVDVFSFIQKFAFTVVENIRNVSNHERSDGICNFKTGLGLCKTKPLHIFI